MRCLIRPALVLILSLGCDVALGPAAAAGGKVQVLVGPEAGARAVIDVLESARRSLWIETYLLTDATVIEALVGRRAAGVDVRVVLEPHPYQADGANDAAFQRLSGAGVLVAWASPRFALTHAKFAVIDGARVVVMTLNFTRSGLGTNREYAVVDDDGRDVAAAEAIVAADLAGLSDAPGRAGKRLLASPGATRPALAAAIASAGRAIVVEMEELSDFALVDALVAARARGCAVSVVLPGFGRSAGTDAAARRLIAGSVAVRLVDAPTIHAKAVVADAWMYVGSANLTAASLDANREVGLALTDGAAVRVVARTVADDLARGRAF